MQGVDFCGVQRAVAVHAVISELVSAGSLINRENTGKLVARGVAF